MRILFGSALTFLLATSALAAEQPAAAYGQPVQPLQNQMSAQAYVPQPYYGYSVQPQAQAIVQPQSAQAPQHSSASKSDIMWMNNF